MSSVAVQEGREPQQKAITQIQMNTGSEIDLASATTPTGIVKRMDVIREVVGMCMKDQVHYGLIPGLKNKTLWKPGMEILMQAFMLTATYEQSKTDFPGMHREYEFKCTLALRSSGTVLGVGSGSCSTFESKYRWRNQGGRVCPDCEGPFIKRSKYADRDRPNDPPGWYCHEKIGGCGSTFPFDDEQIKAGREEGRIENPDLADTWNTVLKMAQKRALAAAISQALPIGEMFKGGIDAEGEDKQHEAEKASMELSGVDPALIRRYFELVRADGVNGTDKQLIAALKRRAAKEKWKLDNAFFAGRIEQLENEQQGGSGGGTTEGASNQNGPTAAPISEFGIKALVEHVRAVAGFADDDAALAGLEKWYRATQQSEEGAEPWDVFKGATFNEAAVLKLKGLLTETNWAPYGGKPKGRK